MNRVVREHYPVSKLPEDLREQFPGAETVRIVVEDPTDTEAEKGFWSVPLAGIKPRTPEQVLADFERIRSLNLSSVTAEDAVARIRALRDEWDD